MTSRMDELASQSRHDDEELRHHEGSCNNAMAMIECVYSLP